MASHSIHTNIKHDIPHLTQEDWNNRDVVETMSLGVKQVADFLTGFGNAFIPFRTSSLSSFKITQTTLLRLNVSLFHFLK